jgi:hypothetical protein
MDHVGSATKRAGQEELDALRKEAHELASALAEAADALRASGLAPSSGLLTRLASYAGRLQDAVGSDAETEVSLKALAKILRAREEEAEALGNLRDLSKLRATVPGYEEAIDSVHRAVARAQTQGVAAETAATLGWLREAIAGDVEVTPARFGATRDRLVEAGFDESLAVALVANHLTLSDEDAIDADDSALDAADRELDVEDPTLNRRAEQAAPSGREDRAVNESSRERDPMPTADGPTGGESVELDAHRPEDEEPPTVSDAGQTMHVSGSRVTAEVANLDKQGPELTAGANPQKQVQVEVDTPHLVIASAEPEAYEPNGAVLEGAARALTDAELSLGLWLLRFAEAEDARPPVSPAVVAALLLADYVGGSDDTVDGAYEDYALDILTSDPRSRAGVLIACAGAMRAAVVLPYGNAPQILRDVGPRLEDSLGELSLLLGERAPRGDLIQPLMGRAVASAAAARETAIAALAEAAQTRQERALAATNKYAPATSVWRQLVATNGPLGALLHQIAASSPDDLTRETIAHFSDVRAVDKEIDQLFNQARKAHPGRIEAGAREWLWRNIGEIVALGREWLALHDDEAQLTQGVTSSGGLVWVRSAVRDLSEAVDAQLDTWGEEDDVLQTAAVQAFRTRWREVHAYIVAGEPLTLRDGGPWREILGSGLARATALAVTPEFGLADDVLQSAGPELLAALDRTWEEALDTRMRQDAHHLTRVCINHISPDARPSAEERRSERLAASHRALARKIEETRRRLDAALREQLLTDTDHAEHVDWLQTIDRGQEDVASALRALQTLDRELDDARRRYSEGLLEQLDLLNPADSDRRRIEDLLAARELAIATECMARLEAGEAMVDDDRPAGVGVSDFIAFASEYESANLVELLRERGNERDVQAIQGLMRLHDFEQFRRQSGVAANVLRLLASLGLDPPSQPTYKDRIARNLQLFEAPVRLGGSVCPVPEFGSRSNGRYRVLVVSDLESDRDFVARIKELATTPGSPILVACAQPIPFALRRDIAQVALHDHVSFLLADPLVVAFAAIGSHGTSRGDRFFSATLPFTWINPYVTHGIVPDEMFFGRDDEERALLDPAGSTFIYGGRQLGKSALLMKALQDFNSPAEGRCAIYLDLDAKRIGHGAPTDLVWSHIATELERQLDTGMSLGRDEQSVTTGILKWLAADEKRQLRVFLDETDHFLEQEASGTDGRARMHNVITMRDLMRQGDGRLKFVLAGLHSVQRFLHLPNQPLAQLGTPRAIGPLSWSSAKALVDKPMAALGYQFEEYVVDRVLTLTNRHPSLIQHVCRSLVDHLARKPRRTIPVPVALRDLEEVYEDRGLRSEIRKRFDWTLDLDPRYRVLAYALAYESLEAPTIRVSGMTGAELGREATRWWPAGFDGLTGDDVIALCDEMVELRVFASDLGHYRLWSPNVMQLLGTKEEIEERLLGSADFHRPTKLDASSDRRAIGASQSVARSPLTYADEQRLLGADGPKIRLVFGTEATGVDQLNRALRACVQSPDWPGIELKEHKRVPPAREVDGSSSDKRVVHLASVHGVTTDWLRERMRDLVTHGGDDESLLLVFATDTIEVWQEIMADLEVDSDLAGRYRAVQLRRWDRQALHRWLDEAQIPTTGTQERDAVMSVTGGWPVLLEDFVKHARSHDGRLDATLASIDADKDWANKLPGLVGVDRFGQLEQCARLLAEIGDACDAATLSEFADDISVIDAQRCLDTLGLAQAAEPVAKIGKTSAAPVRLESCLARVLT